MNTMDYQRRDDRSDHEVTMHRLLMRAGQLQELLERWQTRSQPDAGPYVRQAVEPAKEAARAIASLANDTVERLQVESEEYDIERGALLPGDEIRSWL